MKAVGVILLAGGVGSRMNMPTPKQFIALGNKVVARHSFDLFLNLPEISEIVVVCDEQYRHLFTTNTNPHSIPVKFASSGERRQDSVYNGFQILSPTIELVCIHDSARPFVTRKMIEESIKAADEVGAATVGMPVKFSVKESDAQRNVKRTLPREHIWEIQTPQVIKKPLLSAGFAMAQQNNLTVTDEASLIEFLEHPVKFVEGSYTNLKITTPEDLLLAQMLSKT